MSLYLDHMNKLWSSHSGYFGILSVYYTCRVLNLGYDENNCFNCLTLSSLFWVGFWGLLVKRICCGHEHLLLNICHVEVLAHNKYGRRFGYHINITQWQIVLEHVFWQIFWGPKKGLFSVSGRRAALSRGHISSGRIPKLQKKDFAIRIDTSLRSPIDESIELSIVC